MKLIVEKKIKAILFNVEENVIGNLDIGNEYKTDRDNMDNNKLWLEFDYTALGFIRMYQESVLNTNRDIALLQKTEKFEIEVELVDGEYTIDDKDIFQYVDNLENSEINYIDEKMRLIRLFDNNCFNIKEALVNIVITDPQENGSSYFNSKRPFPDRIYGEIKKLNLPDKKSIERINSFLTNTKLDFPNSKFSPDLLSKACFLYDQTYTSPVLTLRFMTGVIGLETLLVDGKTELRYRLSRNCSMLLSENIDEYKKLLKRVKDIYDRRSEYVHNANIKKLNEEYVIDTRKILHDVIFKIIELNISQKELLEKLDLKGYND